MSVDRNAADSLRLRRNAQKTRAGDGTSSVKISAPLVLSAGAITLNLNPSGGLQNSSSQLGIKLADTSLVLSASGVKLGVVTTKGDLIGFDTAANRVPVGSNGQVLTADSTIPAGVKWATPASTTMVLLKNRIINGNFDYWQRGTSFTGPSAYSADRWFWNTAGLAASANIAQYIMALGEVGTNVPAKFGLTYNATANPTNPPIVEQRVESVTTLAGQQVTLSFWAKGTVGQVVTLNFAQNFGTGGAPSATVNTAGGTATLSAAWQRFSLTITLPSVTGKTLGTGSNDYLGVQFQFGTGATYNVNLAQVQLEPGGSATDFEYRPATHELLLCQRYFERSYALTQATGVASSLGPSIVPNSISALAASTAGNVGNGSFLGFKVEKRATPTIVFFDFAGVANGTHVDNPGTGTTGERDGATAGPVNAAGALQFITYDNSGAMAINRGACIFAHWTAAAEL